MYGPDFSEKTENIIAWIQVVLFVSVFGGTFLGIIGWVIYHIISNFHG